MARHLRVEYPGAIYHVAVRMLGDWKKEENRLFEDDADRVRFVTRLAEKVAQYDIRLYLYVLLTNHVHLVLETPQANCGRFMQALSTAYTVYFNLRHGRHGHLVDGRYRAKVVEADDYLSALSRYVHANPVRVTGLKDQPLAERIGYLRGYRWSSYPGYIGSGKRQAFVDYGPVLAAMEGRRRDGPKRYRAYVESGLAEDDADFRAALKASPRSIGSETFRDWVDGLYDKLVAKHRRPEDVAFRCTHAPLAADAVLACVAEGLGVEVGAFRQRRRQSALRGVAARALVTYSGLTQREIATVLGMGTGAAVSVHLRTLAARLAMDRDLRRRIARVEASLVLLRNAAIR